MVFSFGIVIFIKVIFVYDRFFRRLAFILSVFVYFWLFRLFFRDRLFYCVSVVGLVVGGGYGFVFGRGLFVVV